MEIKFLLILFATVTNLEIAQIPVTGFPPPRRSLTNIVYNTRDNQIISFGGLDLDSAFLNQLNCFDITKNKWKIINPSTTKTPDPRHTAAMWYDEKNNQILIYGGRTTSGPAADFWTFSISKNAWVELEVIGDDPGPRGYLGYTSFIRYGVRYGAIFGGLVMTGIDNGLFM